MNRCNDWRTSLRYANASLGTSGYSIKFTEPEEESVFNCEIWKDGKFLETYAENYYEDELSDLVDDAWAYVMRKRLKNSRGN